jgi:tRNA (guanine-N7-)-methyltransferase
LRDRVEPASVAAVHVYFPDPWWKRRHLKRRLFTAEFVREVTRVLVPGGRLHLATDVEAYFQRMKLILGGQTALVESPSSLENGCSDEYLTNFERKFRREGRAIFRGDYRKMG